MLIAAPRLRSMAGVAALLGAWSASGQTTPPQKPIIRSDVNEVLLDLVVRDKHGRPVTDLRPDEIEIIDDGKPVKITGVHAVGESGSNSGAAEGSAHFERVRLISLVFDTTGTESNRGTRRVVDELLREGEAQGIAFSVWKLNGRLDLVQTFTKNPESIRRAVDWVLVKPKKNQPLAKPAQDLSPDPAMKPFATRMLEASGTAERISREENVPPFFAGLLALVREQISFPGRKTAVYFSDGMEISSCSPSQLESLVGGANRANVSIYSVDTSFVPDLNQQHEEGLMTLHGNMMGIGPQNPAGLTTNNLAQPSATASVTTSISNTASANGLVMAANMRASQQGGNHLPIQQIARETGGFYMTQDAAGRSVNRILGDGAEFYEATYVPSHLDYDGHFRPISVHVTRPHTEVQSRAGYYSFPPNTGADIRAFELPLLKKLNDPERKETIPLRARVLRFGQEGDRAGAEFVLEAPMSELGYQEDNNLCKIHVSVLALVKTADGQVVQKMSEDLPLQTAAENKEQVRAGAFTFQRSFSVAPGKYSIEIALWDEISKTLSTTTLPFSLAAEPRGLSLSDISLVRRVESTQSADDSLFEYQGHRVIAQMDLDSGPKKGDVPFFFTLYPAPGSSSKPAVELQLKRGDNVFAKSPLPVPSSHSDDAIPVVASFSAKPLPAGDYEMVLKATQDGVTRDRVLAFSLSGAGANEGSSVSKSSGEESQLAHLSSLIQPKLLEGQQKPSSIEIQRVIDTARQRAVEYKKDLPNFLCRLSTRRSVDRRGTGDWRQQDVITENLRYIDGNEEHKILHVMGNYASTDPMSLGVHSGGEFGAFLDAVFSSKAAAQFEWAGYADVNGRQTDAYRYKVSLPHSHYGLSSREQRISVAYCGFVYIDPNTMDVLRVSIEAQNIPNNFPIRESALTVDYGYFSFGAQQYLLPRLATLYVREGKRHLSKNEKEFRDYRRYTGESVITFN